MIDIRISELPYVGYTGYTPNDLFVTVNNGDTKNTTLEDLKIYIVSGISVSAGTSVTGFTYTPSTNTFRVFNNNGTSYPATLTSVSGLTVNGNLNVTGSTSGGTFYGNGQGLNNIPLSGITDLTSLLDGKFDKSGGTINGNLTVTGNTNLQSFTAGTGTINGNLTVTGNTNLSGTTLYDENIILGNNPLEITNVRFLTGYVETYDVYVTGTTYTAATNNTDRTTWQFQYHSTPIGNPPYTFTGQNTFITGFTYNDANTFTLKDNSGNTFNSSFNTITGLTINGNLNISGNTSQTGNTTQIGNFNITGNTSQSGNTTQIGNFNITGNTTQSGNTNQTGNFNITGSTFMSGNFCMNNMGSTGNTGINCFSTSLIPIGTTVIHTFQSEPGILAHLGDLATGEPNSRGYTYFENNSVLTSFVGNPTGTYTPIIGAPQTISNYNNLFIVTTGATTATTNKMTYNYPVATGSSFTYLKFTVSLSVENANNQNLTFQILRTRNAVVTNIPIGMSIIPSNLNANAISFNGIAEALHLDEFVLSVRNNTGNNASNSIRITDVTFSMFT